MKFNLPLSSNSVIQVITKAFLLIVVISAVNIMSVLITFNSHIENREIINKLTTLKISTTELVYSLRYQAPQTNRLLEDLNEQLMADTIFNHSLLNTQKINQANQTIQLQWLEIYPIIKTKQFAETSGLLNTFMSSIDNAMSLYQALITQKMKLVFALEIMSFLFILLISSLLYHYSKKQFLLPIKQLIKNLNLLKTHQFDVQFPKPNNEIGVLSQGIEETSQELRHLIQHMQQQVLEKTIALKKAHRTIEFLYTISQQLSTVKLTSPILKNALSALVKQENLQKLCIELNNGSFINSAQGCARVDQNSQRIAIIINGKPYGFLNYVSKNASLEQHALIESFTGLVARALYQEEVSLQEQKIILMEERSIIARELHDSIAQSLSFLKIQCTLLHRQIEDQSQQQAQQTISNIQQVVSDTYVQLRSLLATFRLNTSQSNFKDAILTLVDSLQKQTDATITLNKHASNFYVDASQHIHLLQIVREAVINAIKHSQCKHIDISYLITDQHNVWLNIIDDGTGIMDNGQQHDHYGLSIMQQRADELGATLTISRVGQGTEVKLIFPYKGSRLNQGTESE